MPTGENKWHLFDKQGRVMEKIKAMKYIIRDVRWRRWQRMKGRLGTVLMEQSNRVLLRVPGTIATLQPTQWIHTNCVRSL